MDQYSQLVEQAIRNLSQPRTGTRAPHDVPAIDPIVTLDFRFYARMRERTEIDGAPVQWPGCSLGPVRRVLARRLQALALALDPALPGWSRANALGTDASSAHLLG